MNLLRGRSLQPGDSIGLIAPASGFDEAMLGRGVASIEALGFHAVLGEHIHARTQQYFAGTAQQRAHDLHAMFANPAVRAIVCARGGYGSQALLPLLDLDLIRRDPKPILGCSDLTALQLWLHDQCGLISLHGPMAAGDFARDDGVDVISLGNCFSGCEAWQLGADSGLRTLRAGTAQGRLWGGCLSLMVATLATPLELLSSGEDDLLLFVEDIAERPYKIERMFRQWQQAGKLKRVKGIVFGEMVQCQQPDAHYTLQDVLTRVLEDFAGPVAYGLRSGHVTRANVTLPIGVCATLTCTERASLQIEEAATLSA